MITVSQRLDWNKVKAKPNLQGRLANWQDETNVVKDQISAKISEHQRTDELKAAFHPCVNVYIYKHINKSEIVSIVPWIFKSKHNLSTIRKSKYR